VPYREPLDAVAGAIGGGLFGFVVWLSVFPGFEFWRYFPFDLAAFVAAGAVSGCVLGYWFGIDFFRWMRDHWPGSRPD
jgi:hypothetical protein